MRNKPIMKQPYQTRGRHTTLKLFVQAKAKKNQFTGIYDGRLKLAVAAPPVEGKANKEIVSFLASFFGLKKKQIKLVAGERSRRKTCILEDLEERVLQEKLRDFG